jgi:hypothetical protein
MKTIVVLPTYNEADNLPAMADALCRCPYWKSSWWTTPPQTGRAAAPTNWPPRILEE